MSLSASKRFSFTGFVLPAFIICWTLVISCMFLYYGTLAEVVTVLAYRAYQAIICLLFILVHTVFGIALLRKCRLFTDDFMWILISAGVGLAVSMLLIFILGIIGIISAVVYLVMLIVYALIGFHEFRYLYEHFKHREVSERLTYFSKSVVSILFIAIAINYINAITPPLDYDTLEYHLGCPAEYMREGKIGFIPNNVYCSFPENVEMLFLLCLQTQLELTPKMMHFLFGILALLALYAIAKKKYGNNTAFLACVLFYLAPVITVSSVKAHVDLAIVFYALLVIGILSESANKPDSKKLFLAGLLTGVCLGIKYTAGIILFIPIITTLICMRYTVKGVVLYGLGGFLLFLPWCLKNWFATGNPFFPISVFGVDDALWPAEMLQRFKEYHLPQGTIIQSLHNIWINLGVRDISSPLLVVLFPLVFFFTKDRSEKLLLLLSGLGFLLWAVFTIKVLRFLLPLIPVYALACAVGVSRAHFSKILVKVLQGIILIFCMISIMVSALLAIKLDSFELFFGTEDEHTYLKEKLPHYTAVSFLNQQVPLDAHILYIGEARTHYLKRKVTAGTYFNDTFLTKSFKDSVPLAEIYTLLLQNSIDFIFVNFNEISRLSQQSGGRYLADMDWDRLKLFFDRYCNLVFRDPEHHISVYAVKEQSAKR